MSVDHEPKSLVWKGNSPSSVRNVSNLRSVSAIRRLEEACVKPLQDNEQSLIDDQPPADEADDSDGEPPPLCEDDSDSSDEDEVPQQTNPSAAETPVTAEAQGDQTEAPAMSQVGISITQLPVRGRYEGEVVATI